MNLTQFPLFHSGLVGSSLEVKTDKALALLGDAVTAGEISNVVYKDQVKFYLGRAFENSWNKIVTPTYIYRHDGKRDAERDLYFDLSRPECHTVSGMIKKVNKAKLDTNFSRAALNFLNEIAPIAAAVVSLKDKVVKRQPKPVEDRVAKYAAPAAGKEAIVEVKTVLISVTEAAYVDLIKQIEDGLTARMIRITRMGAELTAIDRKSLEGRHEAAAQFEKLTRFIGADPFMYNLVDRNGIAKNVPYYPMINAEAVKRANEIRNNFVYKNLDKLDSVIERKGDFKSIERTGYRLSLDGLEGSFKLTFKDGSQFFIQNSVVFVRNNYGTEFLRFPLTFHDVSFADGKKMKNPSEKKMNTEFVGE